MPDNKDLATVNRKGLAPKLSGSATDVLRGDGTYGAAPISAASFPLLAPDGSAAAPSYSFANDTNTGIYRSTDGAIDFSADAVRVWQMVNNGGSIVSLIGPPAATSTSNGQIAIISAGPGGSVSGNGGTLLINGGDAGASGNGGGATVQGGSAVGTNKSGGGAGLLGANGTGSGTGGAVGATGGRGGATGVGGGLIVTTGQGGVTSGASGSMDFLTAGTVDGNTGYIWLKTSSATGTDRSAGDIRFSVGNGTGAGTHGNFNFQANAGSADILRLNGTSRHLSHMGTTPALTSGGGGTGSAIAGKDECFVVTIGATIATSTFKVTFANQFTNVPIVPMPCSDTDQTTFIVTPATNTVDITAPGNFTAGSKVYVVVRGYE